jgi:hypothetical protein
MDDFLPRPRRGSVLFLAFSDAAGDEVSLYFPFSLSSGVYFVIKFWRLIGISVCWWVLDFLHLGEGLLLGLSFGWVSQLCAFLREGRQNSFNCSLLFNHVEVNMLLICVSCLCSLYYRASGFPFFL